MYPLATKCSEKTNCRNYFTVSKCKQNWHSLQTESSAVAAVYCYVCAL